jgi:hypothetical protein
MKHLLMAAAIDDHEGHAVAAKEQVNLGQGIVVETDRQGVGLVNNLDYVSGKEGLVAFLVVRRCRRPVQRPLVQIVDQLPKRPTPQSARRSVPCTSST